MASVPACSVSPAARAPQEAGTLPLRSGIRHNAESGGRAAVPYVPRRGTASRQESRQAPYSPNKRKKGTFREHREVNWYADKLCVTPNYLSEVSRKISGYAANYWISRYTVLDISRLLRDRSLTFARISDMFGFSSPAYFSRYVQQHLGVSPTAFRG